MNFFVEFNHPIEKMINKKKTLFFFVAETRRGKCCWKKIVFNAKLKKIE